MQLYIAVVALLSTAGGLASAASYQNLDARDIALLKSAFSIVKRSAYESAYNDALDHILFTRSFEDGYFDALHSRSAYPASTNPTSGVGGGNKKKEKKATKDVTETEYLENITVGNLSGSFGKKSWSRVHGDSKSGTEGVFHMEVGTFGSGTTKDPTRHTVKLVKGAASVASVQLLVDTLDCAVAALKQKYGLGNAPAGCVA